MAQAGQLNKQINKVFHSNLIYFITAGGFLIICMIALIMNYSPLEFLVFAVLGTWFFYIFSILVVTGLVAGVEKAETNMAGRYSRSVYKYNLLNWRLKSKIINDNIKEFKLKKKINDLSEDV